MAYAENEKNNFQIFNKIKKIKYIFILLLLFSIKITAQQQYKSCFGGDIVKWSILTDVADGFPYSMEIFAYGDVDKRKNL
jgi:hypothetical protein